MNRTLTWVIAGIVAMGALAVQAEGPAPAGTPPAKETKAVKAQTLCPVAKGAINKSLYADVNGKRIYVCCAGCLDPIKKDPAKYIKQMEDAGITLEAAPVAEKK